MSNNKQTMKLYTEEQIKRTFGFGMNEIMFDGFLRAMTPIELPSDEEIDKMAYYDFKEKIEKYNSQSNNEQQ